MNYKKHLFRLFLYATLFLNTQAAAKLKITFLNVGHGDAAIIRTPLNKTIVIDTGKKSYKRSAYNAGRDTIIPFLKRNGIKKIDILILTHPHNDHIGGASYLINTIRIEKIIDAGFPLPTITYSNLLTAITKKRIQYTITTAGQTIYKEDKLTINALNPPYPLFKNTHSDANNNSIVLMISYKSKKILFTGDIEKECQVHFYNTGTKLKCDIVKVPHHGSARSAYPPFIKQIGCKIAIISVAGNNPFGIKALSLPSKKTIRLYKQHNIKILRTDTHGHITIITDGKTIQFRTARMRR